MTNKNEEACKYIKRESPRPDYAKCNITGELCGLVVYNTRDDEVLPQNEEWKRCPAYNVSMDLAKKLIGAGIDREKAKLTNKRWELENILKHIL